MSVRSIPDNPPMKRSDLTSGRLILRKRGADGAMLAGELPRKQLRLVQASIELHRDELATDWELARSGEPPYKIDPL